ncbi:MAG: hypothetical protein KatS3mg082_1742 [Nitrospiraceae bacterium]|nr:MAG: hypothetical protein KatS3mg082_1742 [Nitrospiraceae bacterium]
MAKRVNPTVLDQALNYVKNNCNQENACSAEPTTAYEAVDPDPWAASTSYSLGACVRPTTRNGFVYEATTAGTSGASQPTWPTTAGNTVTDGSVTWTCRNNYALVSQAMASGDFTVANGDGTGNTPRKVTMAAKSGASVFATGTANHVALAKKGSASTAPELLEVTTCTSQALTAGNTVNFPSWKIEIGAPT